MTDAGVRLDRLVAALRESADTDRAGAMARYMKGHFDFFGVPAPARRAIQRAVLLGWKPDEGELVEFATAAWLIDEREVQYAACDLLERGATRASGELLVILEQLITTKSWWDTVDALASAVGSLVMRFPELRTTLDRWVESENFWLARVAIIHQLRYKADTDSHRLFAYCERRAADTEFFIRKAIGWALREYAKADPDAVRAFVAAHQHELSGLSKREALKHV
jgi:3-methyladenine DNA glycosylase AlkD